MKVKVVDQPIKTMNTGEAGKSAIERAAKAFEAANASKAQQNQALRSPGFAPAEQNNNIRETEVPTNSAPSVETSPEAPQSAEPVAQVQETTSESSSEEITLPSQYAILAKREKAMRDKVAAAEAAAKAEREEFTKRIAALEQAIKAKEEEIPSKYIPKEELEKDPFKYMDYNKLTEQLLNQPSPEEQERQMLIQKQEERFKALEEMVKKQAEQLQERDKAALEGSKKYIQNQVEKIIKGNPDFELVEANNAMPRIMEEIEKYYNDVGELPDYAEIARAEEERLLEESLKLTKLKKIQARLNQAQKTASVGDKESDTPKPTASQPSVTLTNQMGSSRPLSRLERAILAAKGQLK